jgi:hypothetical protein
MTKGSRVNFMLNLSRGKSLSSSWQNHLDFGLPNIDDAPVIVRGTWALSADRAKVLPPSNPALEDDEDGWRLVPYFGAALCFFSWIGQKGLSVIKRKRARLKFEPNAVHSIAFPNDGPRPSLAESVTVSSIADAPQQKAPEEEQEVLPGYLFGDLDVQNARANAVLAEETDEISDKNFNGAGLS